MLANREIPITPPSRNLLGSRNPLSPNPAEKTPRAMNSVSFTSRSIAIRLSRIAFNLLNRSRVLINFYGSAKKIGFSNIVISVGMYKDSLSARELIIDRFKKSGDPAQLLSRLGVLVLKIYPVFPDTF